MQARAALACALVVGAMAMTSPARAERRPVAVVSLDLAKDAPAIALVARLNVALEQHPRLRRVLDANDQQHLEGYFEPEDDPFLRSANKALSDAHAARAGFDLPKMMLRATDGLDQLASVSPAAAAPLYARLEFELGIAKLGQHKDAEAAAAFVLVRRLSDVRPADTDLPEIVDAWNAAAAPPGAGTVEIAGTGRAWIDGHEVGDAPGSWPVDAGPHLVQLSGPERKPVGKRVDVGAKARISVALPDAPLERSYVIFRARVAIATAVDPVARVAAVKHLAELVSVEDIVFVDSIAAKDRPVLRVQTWREEQGFSAVTEVTAKTDVLEELSPTPPELPKPPPPFVAPVIPPPPLYRRRWFQVSVVTFVVSAIAIGISIGDREGTTRWDGGLGGFPGTARR